MCVVVHSLLIQLRCQVHMELAKCEEDQEQIEGAMHHLTQVLTHTMHHLTRVLTHAMHHLTQVLTHAMHHLTQVLTPSCHRY